MGKTQSTGMVLGKFMPPHQGHLYLCDFARHFVDRLYIVVGTLAAEPIPGLLRHQWMQQLVPQAEVLHLQDENPQYPEEHPDFWDIWRNSLTNVLPEPADYIIASENYGVRLAQELDAQFVPANISRQIVPVSGTAIREAPFSHWQHIPDLVRPYFAKKVSIFGPESVGKSTLAKNLAEHFGTQWVPEYARELIESQEGRCEAQDMPLIALGQRAAEKALLSRANKLLFCDTDPLATILWSEELFQQCHPIVKEVAEGSDYDLTLLLDVDVPWVEDIVRYRPENRRDFYDRCETLLKGAGRNYVRISGSWQERLEKSIEAVDRLIKEPDSSRS